MPKSKSIGHAFFQKVMAEGLKNKSKPTYSKIATDDIRKLKGEHIYFIATNDLHRAKATYYRHGIVSEIKNRNTVVLIGWKLRSENIRKFQPKIISEEVDLSAVGTVFKAEYKGDIFDQDKTVVRARHRIGETSYNDITNYARGFPRWCRTGYGGATYRGCGTTKELDEDYII